jgi:hypothetical protein
MLYRVIYLWQQAKHVAYTGRNKQAALRTLRLLREDRWVAFLETERK